MRSAMATSLVAILAGSAAFAQAQGQTGNEGKAEAQDAKLEFEVASIKPSPPPGNWIMMGGRGGPGSGDPGRLTYSNMTLMSLITMAYGVRNYQVAAGPYSLTEDRFDIAAKVPAGASKDDVKIMMQSLLAERFKLAVHHETKELPIYALIVAKNGSKMKVSSVADTPPAAPPKDGGLAGPPPLPKRPNIGSDGCPTLPESASDRPMNMIMMSPNGACMLVTGGTMENFAGQISNWFDRPVIDMTGLKGKYDYKLHYDPASTPGRGGPMMIGMPLKGGGPPGGDTSRMAAPDPEREPAPSIFSALQEQLGLKLDARKAPIDLVVVDHVEKTPTEN